MGNLQIVLNLNLRLFFDAFEQIRLLTVKIQITPSVFILKVDDELQVAAVNAGKVADFSDADSKMRQKI